MCICIVKMVGGVVGATVVVGASDLILECQDSTPAGFCFPKVLGQRMYFNSWNSHTPCYLVSWYLRYFIFKTTNSKIFSAYETPKETAFRDQKMAELSRNGTLSRHRPLS